MKQRQPGSFSDAALRPFLEFFKAEASTGILLMITTAIAFAWANSAWSGSYFHIWEIMVGFPGGFTKTLHQWINDGLMAVFFLLVGLEIKREMTTGALASLKGAALPIFAAIGGMILPAAIYLLFNFGEPASRGWGIPMATDIAFSLGILALIGPSVPVSLKVFLAAFAIVDDIGAVLVIAFFYTAHISWAALGLALIILACLLLLNRFHVSKIWLYMILGLSLWTFLLKSGVHATVAGVLLAFCIPSSKLHDLERALHPWVVFAIIPIFALANAGVSLHGASLALIGHPVFLGILIALVFGKQFGVFFLSRIGAKIGAATLPQEVTWRQIYGVGWLGGIGFTMSIFISALAFEGSDLLSISKLAILCASLISAIGGWMILISTRSNQSTPRR